MEAVLAEHITPRLLNVRQPAAYLGCSFWIARDYVLQGLIPVVDMPPPRAGSACVASAPGGQTTRLWSA